MSPLGYNCFDCGIAVYGAKDSIKNYVKIGVGRFRCKPCNKKIQEKVKKEKELRREGRKEHWDSIGDLPLE